MRMGWSLGVAIAAGFLAAGSGCVVNEPEAPPRGVVVSGPPPAPVREERPASPPGPQSSWVAGYWHWTGMQYAWIPGHWEQPPAGAVWAAPTVTPTKDGRYVYESGGWKKPGSDTRNALR